MKIPEEAIIRLPNGSEILNLSRLHRAENMKQEHKFKVGDVVVLTMTCEVIKQSRDCDGTPLYVLSGDIYGVGEDSLREATEEEANNF